jgi:hypothetical protein
VSYPAEFKSDGTFTIPGLPQGSAWIRQGDDRFIYTTGRTIDLSHFQLGRPDRTEVTEETLVSMSLTGMAPWAELDDFQMTIANLGFVDSPLFYGADLPELGATTVTNMQFDWRDVGAPWLVSPTKGDEVIFSQLSTQAVSGVSLLSLTRSASLPSLSIADGGSASISAALVSTAPQQSLNVTWARSKFDALRTTVHPSALAFSQDGTISANPGGTGRAELGDIPDVLRLQPDLASTDLSLGALAFRNPFPASWTVYGRFNHLYRVAYTVPGASRTGTLIGSIAVSDTVARLGAATIEPVVGPVRNVTVNGAAALSNLDGVGTTPTLSWDAPATGTPNGFILTLYRLEPIEGQQFPRSTRVATLYTTQSSVVMPKDLMVSGKLYCFLIRAIAQPGVDLSRTPYLVPVQRSHADTLTALISP